MTDNAPYHYINRLVKYMLANSTPHPDARAGAVLCKPNRARAGGRER